MNKTEEGYSLMRALRDIRVTVKVTQEELLERMTQYGYSMAAARLSELENAKRVLYPGVAGAYVEGLRSIVEQRAAHFAKMLGCRVVTDEAVEYDRCTE